MNSATATGTLARSRWRLTPPPRDLALAVGLFAALAVVSGLLVGQVASDNGAVVCACLLAVAVPMVAVRTDRILVSLATMVGVWVGAIGLALVVPDIVNPQPRVSAAAGLASYYDTPYRGQQYAVFLGLLILLAVPVATTLWQRRRTALALDAWRVEPLPRPSRGTVLLLAAGTLLIGLTLLGNVADELIVKPLPASGHGWDSGNLITWNWLEQRGELAVRDFFFPYGGTWAFAVYPLGPVWQWLSELLTLGLFAWALFRLSGGKTVRVVVCVAVVVVFAVWAPGIWRYGPALPVGLCYAAVGPAHHTRLTWGHAVLLLACLNAAFTGPDIFGVYGLASAVLVLVGEWLRAPRPWRQWVRGIAIDAIPFLVAGAALVISWVATDSVDGNVRLWVGLDKAAAGYAIDQVHRGALAGVNLVPALGALAIAFPFLTLGAGLAQTVWNKGRDAGTAPLLLAAGAIGYATLLKVMVRPVGTQLLFVPMLALIWAAILLLDRRKLLAVAASGAALGAAFALFQTNNSVGNWVETIPDVPGNVTDSASLVGKRSQIEEAAGKRFAPARFAQWPETQLAAAMRAAAGGRTPRFATLGDFPVLYILLNQTPPYHINFYDASQIDEQQKMRSELKKEDPEMLVWNQTLGDQVPYWVRDPLIFTWAVPRYKPVADAPLEAFLLAKRAPGEPIAYDWWRAHFASPLDLGYIPALSEGASLPSCTSGPGCAPYAIVKGNAGKGGGAVNLTVTGRGGDYPVVFHVRKGHDTNAVRLDRLWFWPIIGPRPRVASATPGFDVQVVRKQAGNTLY